MPALLSSLGDQNVLESFFSFTGFTIANIDWNTGALSNTYLFNGSSPMGFVVDSGIFYFHNYLLSFFFFSFLFFFPFFLCFLFISFLFFSFLFFSFLFFCFVLFSYLLFSF